MAEGAPTIIVLTPVLNEAWILDSFLRCAATWADHIVVADQGSEDGSVEIAASHPKVTLVHNSSPGYDEAARQRLLIETARAIPIPGRRILIALDSDELLSANARESSEWARVLEAEPGTVIWFEWVNVAPGGTTAWSDPGKVPFGFVDDGRPHEGERIHSRRIPTPQGAPALELAEIKVLHYQCVDWPRMSSKQRWYQCWERVNNPHKRPITLFRQYHHMDAGVARALAMPEEWTAGYETQGITMPSACTVPPYRWDLDVLELFERHGTATFRRLDVWEVDWLAASDALGRTSSVSLTDPRTWFDRRVQGWLARTQSRSHTYSIRAIQRLLQLTGW